VNLIEMPGLLTHLRQGLLSLRPEPTPTTPTINSLGQHESGVPVATSQAVMEWLFASLMNAGYLDRSHLFWLQPHDTSSHRQLRQLHGKGEPIVGYRCGERMPTPPSGYYWRLMTEHTSMRLYQLEVRADD